MTASNPAFVLLHHVISAKGHWDLCLETPERLATWKIGQNPVDFLPPSATNGVPACRIEDHRRAYLSYEGPVSKGRGQVTQADQGTYKLLKRDAETWTVRLAGTRLQGVFRLPEGGRPGRMVRVNEES